MTSYTKKLYERDPALAHTLRKNELEAYRYGRHVTLAQFTPAHHNLPKSFGKRVVPPGPKACAQNCGHPSCAQGCTSIPNGWRFV